jgi:hypothetical protein
MRKSRQAYLNVTSWSTSLQPFLIVSLPNRRLRNTVADERVTFYLAISLYCTRPLRLWRIRDFCASSDPNSS